MSTPSSDLDEPIDSRALHQVVNLAQDQNAIFLSDYHAPTVKYILSDNLTALSLRYWACLPDERPPFDPEIVERIYRDVIDRPNNYRRWMLLELSRYLENYLWPNYGTSPTKEHVMSIIVMINEKFRQVIPNPWKWLYGSLDNSKNSPMSSDQCSQIIFHQFMKDSLDLGDRYDGLTPFERVSHIRFMTNVFGSLSEPYLQQVCLSLVSMAIWSDIGDECREALFKNQPKLKKLWLRRLNYNMSGFDPSHRNIFTVTLRDVATPVDATSQSPFPKVYERHYIFRQIQLYLHTLSYNDISNTHICHYLQHFVQFCTILLSQLSTRRFCYDLFRSCHIVLRSKLSKLYAKASPSNLQARLFAQLVSLLDYMNNFNVDNFTGETISKCEVVAEHYRRVESAQLFAWRHFGPKFAEYALKNVCAVDSEASLRFWLGQLSKDQVDMFCKHFCFISSPTEALLREGHIYGDQISKEHINFESEAFNFSALLDYLLSKPLPIDIMALKSVYPTEDVIRDLSAITLDPEAGLLALPRITPQYLSFDDYFMRHFTLYRLEVSSQVYADLQDAIHRLKPTRQESKNNTDSPGLTMNGWARMALPIAQITLKEIRESTKTVLFKVPSLVLVNVTLNLPETESIANEWRLLEPNDVVFLVEVDIDHEGNPIIKTLRGAQLVTIESLKHEDVLHRQYYHRRPQRTPSRGSEKKNMNSLNGQLGSRPTRKEGPGDGAHASETENQQGRLNEALVKTKVDAHQNNDAGFEKLLLTLAMDPVACYKDQLKQTSDDQAEPILQKLNVIVRRDSRENNFKSVLEAIQALMASPVDLPPWLYDIFVGYGDPAACTNIHIERRIDFLNTFHDIDHLKECFPDMHPEAVSKENEESDRFHDVTSFHGSHVVLNFGDNNEGPNQPEEHLRGPVRFEVIRKRHSEQKNKQMHQDTGLVPPPLRFNRVQTQAIRQAMNHGLTMIVGPPGTGKTDVAVQLLNMWYHNYPTERTLLITHSNNALNQLFEKIVDTGYIDEKHLLRLGHGSQRLRNNSDFSKAGRVEYMLKMRNDILALIRRIAESLGLSNYAVDPSIESAISFFQTVIDPYWQTFFATPFSDPSQAAAGFPFSGFFQDSTDKDHDYLQNLNFLTKEIWDDLELSPAQNDFSNSSYSITKDPIYLSRYDKFNKLKYRLYECRPFEVLKTPKERARYLLQVQSRVVAMTCTHASLKHKEFVMSNFTFNNVLMEEAAQILDVETIIPLCTRGRRDQVPHTMLSIERVPGLLPPAARIQLKGDEQPPLHRVVLIGDHNQLPPVVKNVALSKFASFDTSLFARMITLNVPHLTLNEQARCRPSLAKLFSWNYPNLTSLPCVESFPAYNAGIFHHFQFIDVSDGTGESEPTPHYFQNLTEAEYLIAFYLYLRSINYAKESIALLTTYTGQSHLLREVAQRRCSEVGLPGKITTVDRFQGQQRDIVLVSLVRTERVGHLRDVRRLIVTISRARHGIYVFGCLNLFKDCYEMTPLFSHFLQKPTSLEIVLGEIYGAEYNKEASSSRKPTRITNAKHMLTLVESKN